MYSMNMNGESERVLINEGWHDFQVAQIEEQISKAGNMMFKVTLKLLTEHGSTDVYCIAEEGKRWMLKLLLEACGITGDENGNYEWDISNVKDSMVQAKIKHEPNEWIDRNGNAQTSMQSRVVEFKKPNV